MTSTEFVYCPKKLHVAINGEAYDDRLTREVLDNLLHQNILLRCYAQGQTAQELCDELGVARPYIEDAVNVLLRDEYSELADIIHLALPDEKFRRVGQSAAAASLPEIKK